MPFLTSARQYCLDHFSALNHELRFWHTSATKMLFAAEVIVALALAVWVSEKLGLHFAWWAALSSFAVTKATPKESSVRALQRLLGTIVGGCFGLLATVVVLPYVDVAFLLCGLIGGYTVYRANESPWSYAWLLGAVTAMMVIIDAQSVSSFPVVVRFTLSRISEVAVGISMCLVTGFVFHWISTLLNLAGDKSPAATASVIVVSESEWRSKRILLGVEAGIAVFIVALILWQANISDLSQALVTVIAISVLPAGKNTPETNTQIIVRMVQRLVGCLLAGILGILLLPVLHGSAWLYILALTAGLWLGCHLQQGSDNVSYTGRQFTIAWIMIFIQPHYWSADPHVALQRFYGIILGVLMLAIIMLLVRVLKAHLSHRLRVKP